jgi:hypothetical protein
MEPSGCGETVRKTQAWDHDLRKRVARCVAEYDAVVSGRSPPTGDLEMGRGWPLSGG